MALPGWRPHREYPTLQGLLHVGLAARAVEDAEMRMTCCKMAEGCQYSDLGSGARFVGVGQDAVMALRFLYFAFCAVLRILVRRRRDVAREAEIVILRHEVAVLRRTAGRARFDWADRAVISALAKVISRDRRDRLLVTPATLLR